MTGKSLANLLGMLTGDGQVPREAPVEDIMTTLPTILDTKGRAWLLNLDKITKRRNACLMAWIVEAPWAHPVWHSYFINVMSLRPYVGQTQPFVIYRPMATHQIDVFALDPTKSRQAILEGREKGFLLIPQNYAGQFIEVTDELAAERIVGTVSSICEGRLSPDTDFVREWAALYGNDMMNDRPGGLRIPEERL